MTAARDALVQALAAPVTVVSDVGDHYRAHLADPGALAARLESVALDALAADPTVVERLARALWENCYGGIWDVTWEEFRDTPGADPAYYRRLARAALAALRSAGEDDEGDELVSVRDDGGSDW